MGYNPGFENDDDGPWEVGDAKCLMCGWEWVAVAPLDTLDLECPHCAKLAGRFKEEQPNLKGV